MPAFAPTRDLLLARVVFLLLGRIGDAVQRHETLRLAITNGNALYLPTKYLSLSRKQTPAGQSSPDDDKAIPPDVFGSLASVLVGRLRRVAGEGNLGRVPCMDVVLHRLGEWCPDVEVKSIVSGWVKEDDGFCDFLVGYLGATSSQTLGSHHARITPTMNVQSLGALLPCTLEEAATRCRRILASTPVWMASRRELAIRTFLRELEKQSRKKDAAVDDAGVDDAGVDDE